MKIAILGSVALPIPPLGQGAAEWIAYYQARGLAKKGHQVLLFAPKGSKVPGVKLIEVGEGKTPSGVGREKKGGEENLYGASYKLRLEILNLALVTEEVIKRKDEYDLILNNLRGEAVLLPAVQYFIKKPFIHVLHLPIFKELANLFKKYKTPLISLSIAQRRHFPNLNYVGNVPNCVDIRKFAYSSSFKDYLLYLGSIGRNKNPKEAILAAKLSGEKLIFGGRIKDMEYFAKEIKPLIDREKIKWVGEVTQKEVIGLYQKAKAFLFPTLWQEPFGLVMIEAMSCGTPVIAYANGAVPEVVRDGVTGFVIEPERSAAELATKIFCGPPLTGDKSQIVHDVSGARSEATSKNFVASRLEVGGKWQIKKRGVDGLVEAIKELEKLSKEEMKKLRENCRKHVEENFTVAKMVEGYEKVCQRVLRQFRS